jgi:hypothetical protein
VAARYNQCPQLPSQFFCYSRTSAAILQHVDCGAETVDEILQGSVGQTNGKGVCEYQTFSFPEPLEMTTGAVGLQGEYVCYELEG